MYGRLVLGIDLDLDQAQNVALVAALVCLVGAVVAIWILQTIVQKVVVAVLLLLLGFAAWSQRAALQDCASKVQTAVEVVTELDTTCTFFGVDVSVP